MREKTTTRKVPWWNKGLERQRRIARKEFNKAKATKKWNIYREALTAYNKVIRKSKRASWRSFCESLKELPGITRVQKVLSKNNQGNLGLLKRNDGIMTTSVTDTLDTLLQAHFPENVSVAVDETTCDYGSTRVGRAQNLTAVKEIVCLERVDWAIRSFKP